MLESSLAPRYLRTGDAATYVGLSPRTLEKFRVHGGGPPFYKVGRACLYAIAELIAWAEARRCRSTSEAGSAGR
jgi:hypothetical protein